MKSISKILSCVFGYLFLGLAVLVSAEVIMRRLLGMSLQGVNELGGYVLAVSSCLAFSVALVGRSHIRIDVIHYRLPGRAQAFMNWLTMVLLALFGILLLWSSSRIIYDTVVYHSTAPTPWATPLLYPQSLWYAGLIFFGALSTIFALRATNLLVQGRFDELREDFQPNAAKEELREELEDAARR